MYPKKHKKHRTAQPFDAFYVTLFFLTSVANKYVTPLITVISKFNIHAFDENQTGDIFDDGHPQCHKNEL